MTPLWWVGVPVGLLLTGLGIAGLVLARPSGRRAAAHPAGARAYRLLLVGEVCGGMGLLLLNGSRLAPDGLDLGLGVAGAVAMLGGAVPSLVGALRWHRNRTPAGTLFNPFAPAR